MEHSAPLLPMLPEQEKLKKKAFYYEQLLKLLTNDGATTNYW